jgi:hypothetical protein
MARSEEIAQRPELEQKEAEQEFIFHPDDVTVLKTASGQVLGYKVKMNTLHVGVSND